MLTCEFWVEAHEQTTLPRAWKCVPRGGGGVLTFQSVGIAKATQKEAFRALEKLRNKVPTELKPT